MHSKISKITFKQKKSFESKINAFKEWFAFGAIFFAFGPYYEGNICIFLSGAKRFALQTKLIILRPKKNCNQILHNRDQNDMHSN